MSFMFALFVALAALTPFFGTDSRDGLDWTAGNFWLRRRSGRRSLGARAHATRSSGTRALRTSGSPESTSADPASAAACRTAPAAG